MTKPISFDKAHYLSHESYSTCFYWCPLQSTLSLFLNRAQHLEQGTEHNCMLQTLLLSLFLIISSIRGTASLRALWR